MRDIKSLLVGDRTELDMEHLTDILAYRELAREGYKLEAEALELGANTFVATGMIYFGDAIVHPGEYPYEIIDFVTAKGFDTIVTLSYGDAERESCVLVTPAHPVCEGWAVFDTRGAFNIYLRV